MTIKDEIVYTGVLLTSVAVGFLIRGGRDPLQKQALSTLLGLTTIYSLCGQETVYSLISVCGTLCIIKLGHRQTPLIAFSFVFSFLLIFRCSAFLGLPRTSAVGNAVQLMLTLKLISVAIEIHDLRIRRKKVVNEKDDQVPVKFQLYLKSEPSTLDVFCYSYCYVGLFTGPFFKYRTYSDFLHQTSDDSSKIPWKEEVTHRVKQICAFVTLYLIASYFFSIDYVKSDEFYERGFFFRLFYMVPIFFIGRMRFYSAWLAAECSFITAAFGAYPKQCKPRPGHGPTVEPPKLNEKEFENVEFSFDTVKNINPAGSDWSSTVRDGMRSWNMTVQWWLANYVHKRWPAHLKQFRTAAVLGCSAYWHGIAPGYFGAFLTMPFIMAAEDAMLKKAKGNLPADFHDVYDWVNWFFKMRSFEYMYMAFALLTWHDTYRWWKSVYFIGHILCAVVLAVSFVVKPARKAKEQ